MSAERDELVRIYIETLSEGHGVVSRTVQGNRAAGAILAAGYRKPRIVPATHLHQYSDGSYPVDHKAGTIVQSADGSVWRFDEGDWENLDWGNASLRGPATVLYEPS